MTDHIAAIHVLKGKLRLTDDDYRALLIQLTGQASSKAMTQAQRRTVREHLQSLAARLGWSNPPRVAARCPTRSSPRPRPPPARASARSGRCGTSCTATAWSTTPARPR